LGSWFGSILRRVKENERLLMTTSRKQRVWGGMCIRAIGLRFSLERVGGRLGGRTELLEG
jgi:hypothetical protein